MNNKYIIDLRVKSRLEKLKKIILILTISIVTISASSYVYAEANSQKINNYPINTEIATTTPSMPSNTTMTATVSGWYKAIRTSNERLDIQTNMQVFINGRRLK